LFAFHGVRGVWSCLIPSALARPCSAPQLAWPIPLPSPLPYLASQLSPACACRAPLPRAASGCSGHPPHAQAMSSPNCPVCCVPSTVGGRRPLWGPPTCLRWARAAWCREWCSLRVASTRGSNAGNRLLPQNLPSAMGWPCHLSCLPACCWKCWFTDSSLPQILAWERERSASPTSSVAGALGASHSFSAAKKQVGGVSGVTGRGLHENCFSDVLAHCSHLNVRLCQVPPARHALRGAGWAESPSPDTDASSCVPSCLAALIW